MIQGADLSYRTVSKCSKMPADLMQAWHQTESVMCRLTGLCCRAGCCTITTAGASRWPSCRWRPISRHSRALRPFTARRLSASLLRSSAGRLKEHCRALPTHQDCMHLHELSRPSALTVAGRICICMSTDQSGKAAGNEEGAMHCRPRCGLAQSRSMWRSRRTSRSANGRRARQPGRVR